MFLCNRSASGWKKKNPPAIGLAASWNKAAAPIPVCPNRESAHLPPEVLGSMRVTMGRNVATLLGFAPDAHFALSTKLYALLLVVYPLGKHTIAIA